MSANENDSAYKVTPVFDANYQATERVIVNQGGTSSGKTYAILQVLFFKAIYEPGAVITVVAQDVPNLKAGAYRDAKGIWAMSSFIQQFCGRPNETDRLFSFSNGSLIEFKSYADEQDAKSGKRDYLFVNEANREDFMTYYQLDLRTRKQIYLDYNPSAPFWVHEKLIGEPGVKLLISDHRHNTFLSKQQHDLIENIPDKELWRVYARGLTGNISGLIFPNWTPIEPEKFPDVDFVGGLDFGWTCFIGSTLITTINGDRPINTIKKGDFVLTRNGYKKVLNVFNNGTKKVIEKNIGFDFGYKKIICTFEHNFNVNNEWKKFGLIAEKDSLIVLSSSMEGYLKDTTQENTLSTFTENGKKTASITARYYIEKFIKSIKARLEKIWSYIILMAISLIIISKTLLAYLFQITLLSIKYCMRITKHQKQEKNGLKHHTQRETGMSEGLWSLKDLKTKLENARVVAKNTHQQIHTNGFVLKNATTDGNILQKSIMYLLNVKRAIVNLWETNTSSQNHVVSHAHTSCRQVNHVQTIDSYYAEVYDIEVEDCHEYFANGILVHNCDPTCLVKVARVGDSIFVKELAYETGMDMRTIKQIIDANGLEQQVTYADHAPENIAELRRLGVNVLMARKGQGSIKAGILLMKSMKWFYTNDSKNLKEELKRYEWVKDKATGKSTNVPIDNFNHAIDAIRYAFYTHYFRG